MGKTGRAYCSVTMMAIFLSSRISRVARMSISDEGREPVKPYERRLREYSEHVLEDLDRSMEGFDRADIGLCQEAIEAEVEVSRIHDQLMRDASGLDGEATLHLARIANALQRTGAYARDIAEAAINLNADVEE